VSELISLNDNYAVKPDFLNDIYYPVNPQNRITTLIREKESAVAYLDEALVLSVPTKILISRFKKLCEYYIPNNVLALTLQDVDKIGRIKHDIDSNNVKLSDKLIDCIKLRDPDRSVSTLVNFVFAFEDDSKKMNKFVKALIDECNAIGYNHVQTRFMEDTYVKQPFANMSIKVVFIQFEAKYSDFPFKMADVLYHVVPNRYIKKIIANGLVPCTKSNVFKYPDRVYLFNFDKSISVARMGCIMYKYCIKKVQYLKNLQMRTTNNVDAQNVDDGFYILRILKSKLEKHPLFLAKNNAPKMKISPGFFSKKIKVHDYKRMDFFIDPQFDLKHDVTASSGAIFTYANIPRQLIENDAIYVKMTWQKDSDGEYVGSLVNTSYVNLNNIDV